MWKVFYSKSAKDRKILTFMQFVYNGITKKMISSFFYSIVIDLSKLYSLYPSETINSSDVIIYFLYYYKKYIIKKGNQKLLQYNIYRKITRKEIMEQIKYYIEKYKVISILFCIILTLLIGLIFSITNKKEKKLEEISTTILDNKIENEEVLEVKSIKVDIKGMVETPGVYELNESDRVIDVIGKAGGLKEGANTEYINLSKKLVDEMVIIIYSNEQVDKFKETEPEKEIVYIEHECICPDNINNACINENDTVNTNGVKEESSGEIKEDNLISINAAPLEELMTLSGIGESKAQAIIQYREENDGFKTLEELMNVSGIGEAAYSKIKDNIKL